MTITAPPTTPLLQANLICSLSMFVWAAGLPAADVLIPHVPAVFLTAARMSLAGVAVLLVWIAIEGLGALKNVAWGRGLGIGSLIGLGSFFLIVGQALTDAVTVSIISAALPVVGLTLEVVFDGRRLTVALVLGVLLSLCGGILAMSGLGLGLDLGIGAVMCLGSVVVFTLGSRFSVTGLPGLTPLGRTAVTVVGAGMATTAIAALYALSGAEGPNWQALGLREGLALLTYAVLGMGVSQILWIFSVGSLGIGLAALHINAAPFYVMLILFGLGGTWDNRQVVGALVVALGVMVAQGLLRLPHRRG